MLGSLILLAQMVVACHPGDSLRPVADEIAREEHAAVQDTWSDVRHDYLVWVVSPDRLSDRAIVEFARAWRDRFPATAVGIISGRTPEHAKALWQRGRNLRALRSAAFDTRTPVPKQTFLEALAANDYVTFAGHGGQTYLGLGAYSSLGPGERVESADLPPLRNLVIATASCNVFRPWVRDSIALAFAEKGAAAFAGFAYSPEAGFLIGCYNGLPFRHTSPEFPIGRVVQLQNRGAMRAFAALPIYFLLGDPRIAFAVRPPYSIAADENRDGQRVITLAGAPRGLVPVRIRGGAGYEFVEAARTAAAREHGFYNSRLQALDAGEDKYILVDHGGGPLTLMLRKQTPLWWLGKTLFVEPLDNMLVFIMGSRGGNIIVLAVAFMLLLPAACCGAGKRALVAGAVAGAVLATLHAAWMLARLDHFTLTSKSVSFSPLAILATFVVTGSAATLYLRATSRWGRTTAVFVAVFPSWLTAVFHFGFTANANFFVFRPHVGASIYSHRMALLAGSASVILFCLVLSLFSMLRRRAADQRHGAR